MRRNIYPRSTLVAPRTRLFIWITLLCSCILPKALSLLLHSPGRKLLANRPSHLNSISNPNSISHPTDDVEGNEDSFKNRLYSPSSSHHDVSFINRRALIRVATSAVSAIGAVKSSPSSAAELSPIPIPMSSMQDAPLANSYELENGLLESRVLENLMSPPPYGMESTDIFYPSSFNGLWDVSSVTTDVQAPCGVMLFGGNATYARAINEIGSEGTLKYKSRFINVEGSTVADREFNVREIAKASVGINAVLDIPMATPNKLCCYIAPPGANSVLQADLITLARRQENISEKEFHCSEVVRQIIAPAGQGSRPQGKFGSPPTIASPTGGRPPLLKEIETASLYVVLPPGPGGEISEIRCRQRSATFLLPSQQDPITYQMWQMSRGRPIDVRFYDIVYTKRNS